ncbi:MAG: wax ester/triacylglycerol synthase family O-acyltransferase [Pseudomonadota bacterium]
MRLSASDASFLYGESQSGPMHISSIYVLEGELSYDTVLKHIEDRLHLIPSYRRKIAQVPLNMGHPKWVDDPDFDIRYHVRHHQLPDGATLQDGIDAAARLNEPMMDRNRPLWHFYVISGLEDRTLILQMTHHAMIDGASGIELTTIIYDFDPKGEPVPEPDADWHPQPTPGRLELFQEALQENLQNLPSVTPADLDPAVINARSEKQRELNRRATELFSGFVTRPAITAPFNASLVGPKRNVRFLKRSFAEIREIRRALGGTINDVVLTVVSEGIARYLKEHEEPVGNQHMRIMCPVNVRTEDQQGALGNQVSAIFPMLPAWSMPLKSRLGVVCAETERIKSQEEAQAVTLATESSSGVWPLAMAPTQLVGTAIDPTALMARIPWPIPPNIGWRPPNPGINFVCTNVPGVQVPQYLAGHKVLDTIGLLILSGNIGFSVTILSYNKELYFNFICEPRLLPDLHLVVDSVADAFDELLEEARNHVKELTGNA